jgi:hypothetical protein
MVNISAGKPLLYQFAWKVIRFIENKKTKTWMRDNSDSIAHLPLVFMAKIHQFFMHLALFSQNMINTNKIEIGDNKFESKNVSTAVRLAAKFFNKMQEHVEDNSIPKDVPAFAKSFFIKATGGGGLLPHQRPTKLRNQALLSQLMAAAVVSANPTARNSKVRKKQKKEFSNKSLKMGLFHVKKGTPASKALPNKCTLKDGATICMDFCCHERKCNFNHLLCKNGKHYTNWKNVPEEDKLVLLKHMDMMGLMWLDAESFEKHKITIAREFVHLLGNATGPKQQATKKST